MNYFVILLFLFIPFSFNSQDAYFVQTGINCSDVNTKYLATNKANIIAVALNTGDANEVIKKCKLTITGANFYFLKNTGIFWITPNNAGTVTVTASIKTSKGKKIVLSCLFEAVKIPEISVEIDVTSPDSRFMWFKLIDKKTATILNPQDYEVCQINYTLTDSLDTIKEQASSNNDADFFPSLTLQELPSRFQLNDKLHINISIIDKKTGIGITNNGQTIIINKLWK